MMSSGDSETYLGPSSHRFFHKMIISPSPLSLETVPHWDIIPLSPPDMTFPQFLLCLDATGAKSWKFSSFMFSQHISRGHSPPPQSWQPFKKFSTKMHYAFFFVSYGSLWQSNFFFLFCVDREFLSQQLFMPQFKTFSNTKVASHWLQASFLDSSTEEHNPPEEVLVSTPPGHISNRHPLWFPSQKQEPMTSTIQNQSRALHWMRIQFLANNFGVHCEIWWQ